MEKNQIFEKPEKPEEPFPAGPENDIEASATVHVGIARKLKSRHIQFIALGGTIGTGLFLGIGSALTRAGPLSIFLGYSITGIAIWMLMQVLAEMAVWISLPGAIPQFCARYVDPALGFAVGWNNWYFCGIALPTEISAAAILVGYWNESISIAVWISIFIALIVILNIFGVGVYGEAEFIFASIKIVTMVGLLILALVLDLGGGPSGDRLGFHYWNSPGAMKEYMATGNTGRFLGLFSTFVNAAFSYAGVEIVAVASGESKNPKRNLPKAARRIFWRILFFYSLGSLAIGVLVPYNEPSLLSQQAAGVKTAAASPWVIAIQRASIPALPSIINAVILSSALSSGNAFLYTGSRYLLALASNGHAPKILLKTTKAGNPIYCVTATSVFSLLTYLSVSSGPNQIFLWFQSLSTMCTLLTWSSICVAYLHFHGALKANHIDRRALVHRAPFQPYGTIVVLAFFLIIIVFNGFAVFFPGNWDVYNFVTAYVGIPIFLVLLFGFKLLKRTHWLPSSERDLYTGKAEIDALDEIWEDDKPKNFWQKIWNWIA
ncbi:amino acid transporter AAT family [Fusarium pseudocircinatum]|uniref:Amino acid transporter AAT family n=1 Tax=Fusarium pseudocircinatum TaxID=56676 RepID=A0A8H5KMG1_9HYPO|nr:amino acid transporter AAT family [Fusarium pseudocircinatum]